MAFFRNSTVNLLNLHYGIHAIALTGGGAFFTAYLIKSGVPVAGALLALAAILLGRFIIRPVVIPLAARFGVRRLVIAGALLSACQYPFLAEVNGMGAMLIALCLMSSFGDTLYWSTYHAYFAALGDPEHRGHQIGAREAIAAIVGIFSPLFTGWMLFRFGPHVAFYAMGLIVAASAVPLLRTPEVPVARDMPGGIRAALPGLLLFLSDGWVAGGYVFLWQIALFLSLGQNVLAYGGALALAALVGAVSGMVLGRHIDAGHGTRALILAYGAFACIIVLRASALGNPALAVVANALGALGSCLYTPVLMTAVYNQAKRSPCTLRFHVVTEAGWDLGGAASLLLSALLVELGAPLWSGVLLSLLGAIAGFVMLRRYYAGQRGIEAALSIP
jgi:MFS transporter, DHA1 family, inner membrane transport protein